MIKQTASEDLIVILGPTASGKTRLAVSLAEELNGEIISADSRQVFRGMDIGSGKDLDEYGNVPYHLIDILDAGEEFSVFEFQRRYLTAFTDISSRMVTPILCGGSGMYLDSVLRSYQMIEVPRDEALRSELADKSAADLSEILLNLKPNQHNSTDLLDRERTVRAIEIARGDSVEYRVNVPLIRPSTTVIGIHWERELLRKRITDRLHSRMDTGMIAEVERLLANGIKWDRLNYYGLEYRYVASYIHGEISFDNMIQKLSAAIHDFAKRQMNWFRRMERNNVVINWVEGNNDPFLQAQKILKK